MTQRINHVQPPPDPFKKRGAGMKSVAMASALLLGVLYAPTRTQHLMRRSKK
jgi:hypothetical protein